MLSVILRYKFSFPPGSNERKMKQNKHYANDTIWREALWKCLRSIGVDKVMADLIESMYKQT